MSKIYFTILIITLSIATYGQKRNELDLNGAIQYALNNSATVLNAKLKVLDAKKQKIETRAIGLPKISVGAGYNYFLDIPTQLMPDFLKPAIYGVLIKEGIITHPAPQGGQKFFPVKFGQKHNLTLKADLNTIIFSGEYIVALKTSKVFEDFTSKQLQSTVRDIKDKTRSAYIPALLIKENIGILDKNIANLEKLKSEMDEMYKEGFVEKLDADRIGLSLQNLKIEKDNLTRQLEVVKNALKLTIGMDIKDTLILKDNIENILEGIDVPALLSNFDFAQRPDFNMLKTSLELQKLNIKRYQAQYLPTLVGFGSYSQKMTGNNADDIKWYPTSLVGLQLNFKLFDGFGRKAKVQRAKIALDMAQNNLDNMKKLISMQVENARKSFYSALERVRAREDNLKLAQKIYDTTKVKYKEGVGSSVELTQAEQSLYQAQSNLLKAKYDLLDAEMKLLSAIGK